MRAFQIAEELRARGIATSAFPLYRALVEVRQRRSDDIVATCMKESGSRLTWSMEQCSPEDAFDWARLEAAASPSLRRFLAHAGFDARSRTDPATSRPFTTISTSEVFRVYRASQPWIAAVFTAGRLLPPATLADDEDTNARDVFDEKLLGVSFCFRKTAVGLLAHTPRNTAITEHEFFFDLARFGAGESSGLVRTSEEMERLNELSRELGIGRITRHGSLDDESVAPA